MGHALYVDDGGAMKMHALAQNKFQVTGVPVETILEFSVDEEGKAIGLTVYRNGRYEWKKIE